MKIAVVGASGFVGSAVSEALVVGGHEVKAVRAPRVQKLDEPKVGCLIESLRAEFARVDAVVVCSGRAEAGSSDEESLLGANAFSSAIVARAAKMAGTKRLVFTSSAAVQGRRPILDASEATEEFSAYSYSKAEGERLVRQEFPSAVIYRPPGVHGDNRRVTQTTARVARSVFASVAYPGNQPSPQALIGNVAAAISFLATTEKSPPSVVTHPWEGLTVWDVMELLGGKSPRTVPHVLARAFSVGLYRVGGRFSLVAANARRLEMLWFGQGQAESWLSSVGWSPPFGREAWRDLGASLRRS